MKYVLLGLGNIGSKRLTLLGDRCAATVDPYNSKAHYRNLRECPENSYDAVILSVPNKVKLELLRWCLEHGKHVLIEKPLLFPTLEVAQEFYNLTKSHHAIWYTSYNHRFEPLINALKKELDAQVIGKLYYGRLFYGNGTVSNATSSWRGKGMGVLEDLGSHLLDLIGYLLDLQGTETEPWSLEKHESSSLDHCIITIRKHHLVLEMSFLSWKNNFTIDLYGENGSIHLKGLCKWGPSELTIYERARPTGVPRERRQSITGPDVTWQYDLEYFEELVKSGESSFKNDLWISQSLQNTALSQTQSTTSSLG